MTIASINGCLHGRVRCLHMSVNPKCCLGIFWWLLSSNAFSAVLQDSSLCMFALLRVPHWSDGRWLSQPDVLDVCDLNILMFTHLVKVNLMFNFPSPLLLIPANLLPFPRSSNPVSTIYFPFPVFPSILHFLFLFCSCLFLCFHFSFSFYFFCWFLPRCQYEHW